MNVFEPPRPDASFAEITEYFVFVREYLLHSEDPNESSDDGQTLLTVGLALCSDEEFIPHVMRLLDRGADPNCPSPHTVFALAMATTSSFALIQRLLDHGLRINEVVELSEEQAVFTDRTTTLLDFSLGVERYLGGSGARKLANKHAGGLGARRKFVSSVVELLQQRGAKRLNEL